MKGHRKHYWACLVIAILLVSCAPARWQMTVQKEKELVWPPPPNPVKASYLGEITGFTQMDKSISTVIFGKSSAGKILKPLDLAIGGDGRIAVVDAGKKGVHFFIPAEEKYILLTRAGSDMLVSPVSVTFDENMTMYLSDSALNKVFSYDVNGIFEKELLIPPGKGKFVRPTGLVFNAQLSQLYVVDTLGHAIHKFDDSGVYTGSFGKRGTGKMEFNMPTHIGVDPQGSVYITDAMNFRAKVFTADDNFVSGFGHHGNGSGDFAMPKGIVADRWGVVYVAETLFDKIQLFNIHGDFLLDIGSKGSNPAEFWMPSGIFIDRNNVLYVCDTYNKRIQLFQLYSMGGGIE